jgi:hypothetical protein
MVFSGHYYFYPLAFVGQFHKAKFIEDRNQYQALQHMAQIFNLFGYSGFQFAGDTRQVFQQFHNWTPFQISETILHGLDGYFSLFSKKVMNHALFVDVIMGV